MPHCKKQMISFFLTTECNLCCRYCYNSKERAKIDEMSLSLDIAKGGIDYYFKNNKSRHIRFYGPGEPTQDFNKMKEITKYAKNISNGEATVEIQTNGVFTEEVRQWVLENVNIVWMSFDGPPDIQNYNRPLNPKYRDIFNGKTSAEVLEENVRWLNENSTNHDLMVGARVTMTEKNIERQKEMVDYFYGLGVRYAWTNPLFYTVDKIPVCDDLKKKSQYDFDMDKYIDYYVEAYHYAKDKGMFWGSFLGVNFDGEAAHNCRACTPTPHLTPDGYVSACDMVLLGKEPRHMECFIYGEWDDRIKEFKFDDRKIEILRNRASTSDNFKHCHNCEAQLYCGGYCLGEVVNETGKLNGVPKNCNAVRRLLNEIGTCEAYAYLHP